MATLEGITSEQVRLTHVLDHLFSMLPPHLRPPTVTFERNEECRRFSYDFLLAHRRTGSLCPDVPQYPSDCVLPDHRAVFANAWREGVPEEKAKILLMAVQLLEKTSVAAQSMWTLFQTWDSAFGAGVVSYLRSQHAIASEFCQVARESANAWSAMHQKCMDRQFQMAQMFNDALSGTPYGKLYVIS
jgi:hypothetical protein